MFDGRLRRMRKKMEIRAICQNEIDALMSLYNQLNPHNNGINNEEENGLITKDYGETQFNNSKHMMRHILEKIREEEKKD